MNKNFLLVNINNKIKYSNKKIFNFMYKKLKKGKFVIKKIEKVEKLKPSNINDYSLIRTINWKPKNSSIKKIINTNLKWFRYIYKV